MTPPLPSRRSPWWRRRRRISHVQQTTASDCGAACLAMVLDYHGRTVRLEAVREAVGLGRGGVDALGILRAARWFGLRGRGIRIDQVEDLAMLPPGSVLHWRFNHFVVIERLHRGRLEIVDPSGGRRSLPLREVDRDFTGVALAFQPSESFRTGNEARGGRAIASYMRRFLTQSGLLSKILITSLLVQVFALSVPFLIGLLVDEVIPRGQMDLLLILGSGLAVVALFSLLSSLIRGHLLLNLRTRLDEQLTLDFLDHLVELPFPFFQQRSAGDLMMRMNSNATIREILTGGVLSTVLDGLLVSFYVILLFVTSMEMALVVLALGLLRIAIFLVTRNRHRQLMTDMLHTQASSQAYQVQMLTGIGTLKSMGAEHRAVEHWSNLYTDVLNVSLSRGRLSVWVDSLLEALAVISPLAILLYGAVLVLQGELSLGMMLAVNALAVGFLGPLSKLVSTAFQLQLLGSYLERIEDVLQTPREQDAGKVRRAPDLSGRIRLNEVSFRYSRVDPPAVRDVSVEIPAGRFVALVGRSGAGKSTLANLLLGLYVPTQGNIYFDDADLEELDLRSVRRQVGVVEQSPFLFGVSIRDNIAMTQPNLPLESIEQAARLAHIHDEIISLPLGYDTILADGGSSLSGGQRQRIALARALVEEPAILLLDEATSNLDAIAEAGIHRQLNRLPCTRIVIAHRLSTIKNADQILMMEQGRVVESGTHQQLMALRGAYHHLVANQVDTAEAQS